MKRFLMITVPIGFVLGLILATIVAPKMVYYWYTPPTGTGLSCAPAVEWALGQVVKFQLAFMVIGGVLGGVLAYVLRPKTPAGTNQGDKNVAA